MYFSFAREPVRTVVNNNDDADIDADDNDYDEGSD